MAADNVISALAAVQAELGGIQKLTPEQRRKQGAAGGDERGVTYAYRGIDQIAAAAQPLFGKHGVVIVPSRIDSQVVEVTLNGRPWSDRTVLVHWTIYGPGGVTDMITAQTEGIGRDNSDKGANKALTGAYKNLLTRLLTVGDPADDTDGHTHEADPTPVRPSQPAPPQLPSPIGDLIERLKLAGPDRQQFAKAFCEEHGGKLTGRWLDAHPAVVDELTGWLDAGAPLDPDPVPVDDTPTLGDLIADAQAADPDEDRF